MRYRDLVEFDPIDSVIQLRVANEKDAAARLVDTYVISQRMADQLANIVIPQLRLDSPTDHKGVLVVGNYGTGKSHLMSVISALAEHADLLSQVRNENVRAAAESIAGEFLVVRGEIGGVRRSLRDIVLTELEHFFSRVGTPYTFPPDSQISNNKDPLIEALAGFSAKYPEYGVLFVLDELLDYLRTREERELILDLGFLREVGEVTEVTPFRFIAGVQETLFDNPRFTFVAQQLRRVRDRFEQIRIAREDIAYVVAQRLLRKTDAQLALINEHLRRFGGLYPQLPDRMAEYAQLFPIHPAYIETFERVYVAEKREVLQTFSRAIASILDQEVPEQQPGLISYDHYWDVLRSNPSLRTLPGVTEVVQKSDVLLDRVTHAFPKERALLKPMALRIVHALSVHRLTSELDTPLGVTAEELRDQLCLWVRLPEPTADFLADQVRVTLREILRTVNGQYITYNEENGQYYLDLKKDIDFDSNIEERGDFLDERDLNKYFFSALQSLLDIRETSYVTNFRIWEYQLPWPEKKVTRPGYLFLGSPRERSTAQPPRDFYLYFLPPFGPGEKKATEASDEVWFALQNVGAEFENLVRRYAGARALAHESASNQQTYSAKADTHQRALTDWLQAHFRTHLRVMSSGKTYTIAQALALAPRSASTNFREQVDVIASALLAPHFAESYPTYPAFTRISQNITEAGRKVAAKDAILYIARGTRTAQAIAVLVGLGLLDEQDHIRPEKSPYAQYFLGLLTERDTDQVVNRGEVLTLEANAPVPVFKDGHFKLEPEWVVLVLLALVYSGDITLTIGRDTLDASNIERAALLGLDTLTDFRYYRRPQELPVAKWRQIFEALGLPPNLVVGPRTREDAVRQLQERVSAELNSTAELVSTIQSGINVLGTPLFTDRLAIQVARDGFVAEVERPTVPLRSLDILPDLRRSKQFLEALTTYNTPGKLRNLQLTKEDIDKDIEARTITRRTMEIVKAISQLQPLTEYLGQALMVLPSGTWSAATEDARDQLIVDLRRALKEGTTFDLAGWSRRLTQLRQQYIEAYTQLHQQTVLGPQEAARRRRLKSDPRYLKLTTLSQVDKMNAPELRTWEQALEALPACVEFHSQLLDSAPVCPSCRFQPTQTAKQGSAASRLGQLEAELDLMLARWEEALQSTLRSETAQENLSRMTAAERQPIDQYFSATDVPLSDDFVHVVNKALRGIQMVSLNANDLLEALVAGGFPCTEDDLRQRFETFLRDRMRGYDARNTRLSIERTGDTQAGVQAAAVTTKISGGNA
jgi:hypothetical protein